MNLIIRWNSIYRFIYENRPRKGPQLGCRGGVIFILFCFIYWFIYFVNFFSNVWIMKWSGVWNYRRKDLWLWSATIPVVAACWRRWIAWSSPPSPDSPFLTSKFKTNNKRHWNDFLKKNKKKQANKPTKKNEQTKHYWLGSIFFWAANSSAWIDIHWIYHVSIGLILIEPTDRSCWLITQ